MSYEQYSEVIRDMKTGKFSLRFYTWETGTFLQTEPVYATEQEANADAERVYFSSMRGETTKNAPSN